MQIGLINQALIMHETVIPRFLKFKVDRQCEYGVYHTTVHVRSFAH